MRRTEPSSANSPQKGTVIQRKLQFAGGAQHSQQDGQVVHRALLPPVGGGQIDGDAGEGEAETGIADGGADPLLGLLDGGIRQTHQIKGGQTAA